MSEHTPELRAQEIKTRRLEIAATLAEWKRAFFVDGIKRPFTDRVTLEAEYAALSLEARLIDNAAGYEVQPLYTHPSPPDGMVGGWMPIETAPKYTEHGVSQHLLLGYAPDEIHEDGFVSQGYWMEAEEDAPDNMGHDGGWVDVHFDFFRCGRSFGAEAYRSAGTQPTHYMPLPPPPTTPAGSGKGE